MQKSFKSRLIAFIVLLSILFSSLITASVAWLSEILKAQTDGNFSGSSLISYFAGGTGEKADPYIISEARHLYNLSWLQNLGAFENRHPYFKVANSDGSPADIDMAGMLSNDGVSGAIPPIGSISNPFKGEFNGNGSIIRNLWVSTSPDDWKRMPQGLNPNFDTEAEVDYVGLFGAIGDTAIVYNFKLDKIEVKTHIDATVGIICGYVDAMVFDIGVYNGIITATNGAVLKSDYSILGAKSDRIVWEDMPEVKPEYGGGDEGGVIRVDVSDYLNYPEAERDANSLIAFFPGWENVKNKNDFVPLGSAYNDISEKVPDAVKNRVFLVRSEEKSSGKYNGLAVSQLQSKGAFHIYASPISSRGAKNGDGLAYNATTGQRMILGSNGTNSITSLSTVEPDSFATFTASSYAADYAEGGNNYLQNAGIVYNEDFYNRIRNYASKPYILRTGTAPISSANIKGEGVNTREVTINGNTVNLPTNGVWFKPMAPGACIISFGIGNMGSDETRSIYRFKRDNNGNIIEWTETVLLFSTANFNNTDVVAFQYDIEPEDVSEKYEFFIATSAGESGNDALGFVFLAVAGASNTGGPSTGGDGETVFRQALYDVDYVVSLTDDITADDYTIHQTLLKINDYTAPVGNAGMSIYYLAKTVQNDPKGFASRVFYYYPDIQSDPNKIIDITVKAQSQSSNTPFADRETVASGSG